MKGVAIFATSAVLFTSLFVWSPSTACGGINFIVLVPALGFWIATVYAVTEERKSRRAQWEALEQALTHNGWPRPGTLAEDASAADDTLDASTPRDRSALRA